MKSKACVYLYVILVALAIATFHGGWTWDDSADGAASAATASQFGW